MGHDQKTLRLTGEVTVQGAARLRSELLAFLADAEHVRIDASAATEVDVACLQLLCAAHRTAVAQGKKLCLAAGTHATEFGKAAKDAGYFRSSGCGIVGWEDCLWCEERSDE